MIKIPNCLHDGIGLPDLLDRFPALSRVLSHDGPVPLIPDYPWLAIEGVDGAGKGLFLSRLLTRLSREGLKCIDFRTPGGTGLGETLRAAMKGNQPAMIHPSVIVPAMAANTADVLERIIAPQLMKPRGKRLPLGTPWLVSDRWPLFSGAVYQADYFAPRSWNVVRQADLLQSYGSICPPVMVYMQVTADTSLRRRPPGTDQFEQSAEQRRTFVGRYENLVKQIVSDMPVAWSVVGSISGMNFQQPVVITINNDEDRDEAGATTLMDAAVDSVFRLVDSVLRPVTR